jgi:L-asparaginase
MALGRRKVLIIYTGGTFGMDSAPRAAGQGRRAWEPVPLRMSGMSADALRRRVVEQVPELRNLAECTIDVVLNRDSAHIGPDEWAALAGHIRARWARHDGVVVLHGTDTLAYAASALSFLLQPCRKPVILTGAQRPLSSLLTDARRNLIAAVEIAAYGPRPLVNQVCIFFDDRLLQGNRTRKLSATQFHAFDSPGHEPLASVGTHLKYAETPLAARRGRRRLQARFDRRVAVLRMTPAFPAAALKAALGQLSGIVLEVFPSGTGPTHDPAFLEFLADARRRGIPVVLATEGNPELYEAGRALLQAGCLWAGAMTPEAAFVKLSLLLRQPGARGKFARLWKTSLAGEI